MYKVGMKFKSNNGGAVSTLESKLSTGQWAATACLPWNKDKAYGFVINEEDLLLHYTEVKPEFKVGQKYRNRHSESTCICLALGKTRAFLQWSNGMENVWRLEDIKELTEVT